MIERTYSKFIANHGDEQMRRAVFDIDVVADGNVVRWRVDKRRSFKRARLQ
jgi:archaellum component FlaG (FlaF/FlaG flagellin family)